MTKFTVLEGGTYTADEVATIQIPQSVADDFWKILENTPENDRIVLVGTLNRIMRRAHLNPATMEEEKFMEELIHLIVDVMPPLG